MKYFLPVTALVLLFLAVLVYVETRINSAAVLLPPSSLEQWYKPANKRQVWLHTMFSLRRSMQAVSEYAASGDQALLLKWSEKLAKDYKKAAEMVPEWRDKLKPVWTERLLAAVNNQDRKAIEEAHRKLGKVCDSCHRKYRAVTAAIYRAPDFSRVQVKDSATGERQDYADAMGGLSTALNRMVIAMADQRMQQAQEGRQQLIAQLDNLAASCSSCHKDKSAMTGILGPASREKLEELGKIFDAGDRRKAGRAIGEIAVSICARCHGIHRTLTDLRASIIE